MRLKLEKLLGITASPCMGRIDIEGLKFDVVWYYYEGRKVYVLRVLDNYGHPHIVEDLADLGVVLDPHTRADLRQIDFQI